MSLASVPLGREIGFTPLILERDRYARLPPKKNGVKLFSYSRGLLIGLPINRTIQLIGLF